MKLNSKRRENTTTKCITGEEWGNKDTEYTHIYCPSKFYFSSFNTQVHSTGVYKNKNKKSMQKYPWYVKMYFIGGIN